MAGEHDAIAIARQALDHIDEGVRELVTSSATHAAKIDALVERVEKIEDAINGGGRDNPGLETRVALLERAEESRAKAERKRASQPAAPAESEIAKVETARAVAAKSRWDAVGKWGPWAASLAAVAAQLIQWARSARGGP